MKLTILAASNEEKIKMLDQKLHLVASDEEKIKVLDQKLDLVASDEDKIKVLDQKLDLVTSDEEKTASVLNRKLTVLRNMVPSEAAQNIKIETIAKLMPHVTPQVQEKLQEESARATAALIRGQPSEGVLRNARDKCRVISPGIAVVKNKQTQNRRTVHCWSFLPSLNPAFAGSGPVAPGAGNAGAGACGWISHWRALGFCGLWLRVGCSLPSGVW
eukprot:3932871-Rhodomonas_salina.2